MVQVRLRGINYVVICDMFILIVEFKWSEKDVSTNLN